MLATWDMSLWEGAQHVMFLKHLGAEGITAHGTLPLKQMLHCVHEPIPLEVFKHI